MFTCFILLLKVTEILLVYTYNFGIKIYRKLARYLTKEPVAGAWRGRIHSADGFTAPRAWCRSWTGIDERKGIGTARVEWSGTTKAQASGAGDRAARAVAVGVAITGRGRRSALSSSEAKANRAVTRTCSGWVRYTDDTWLV